MTKYKVILELEVEEIQQPPLPERELWDNIAIIPGNYLENIKIVNKRLWKMKPRFSAECRFGGFCTDKELYEDCIQDDRVKNNWMCWRDGIQKSSELS